MRLLVVTDDLAATTNLQEPLEEIAAGAEVEVKIVAPLRPRSTLDLVTGDIDEATAGAWARAETSAVESRRADAVTDAPETRRAYLREMADEVSRAEAALQRHEKCDRWDARRLPRA